MKPIIISGLVVTMLFLCSDLHSQKLSAATNDISVNLTEGLPDVRQLPVIHWISPKVEFTNSQERRIDIEAEVKSVIPIESILLRMTDAGSGLDYGVKNIKFSGDNQHIFVSEKLHLPDGSMTIELVVKTKEAPDVSSSRHIMVGQQLITDAVMIDRKDYALIFATDKYDHWDDLVNPVNDGRTIAETLKERYGFETEVVENPTIEAVWEKIRSYNERKFKPQDQLLVFFAGHGHFDESFGEGYVVAKNSLAVDNSRTTYISHNRLRGVINNIPCEHIFLLMDVCFGGTFDPVLAKSRSLLDAEASREEVIVRKLNHKTRKYLTSGGKEYVSDGIPGHHSPFAGKLIEALKSNGGGDRILTIAELQASLEKLKQLPRFGSFGEDEPLSDFVFISR